MNTSKKVALLVIDFIRSYDSPQLALKAVNDAVTPNKCKRAKKFLAKSIRKYIYFSEGVKK